MITYTGKYNSANVMIDLVDETTSQQIYTFLNHPAFAHTYIAIMPDTHAGEGAVIGYTAKMNDYVIPNVVGVDIGCGVLAVRIGDTPQWDLKTIDDFIHQNIPAGFAHRGDILSTSEEFVQDIMIASANIGLNYKDVLRQLATLGGGNHFIEIDKAPDNSLWLIVHTGSRNFGLQIAKAHQKVASDLLRTFFAGADAYKKLEYLPVNTREGQSYLGDMKIAQNFAKMNRFKIADIILTQCFNLNIYSLEQIESVHNYINFDDNIIRKGAIQANLNQRLLIPFNMRDGIAVCTGKGNKKWNNSAPHGAGRILSRRKAKDTLTNEEFQKQMEGIYTTTANQGTIDESPMVYKDKDIILEAIQETVNVDFLMKPIYNFKAGGD
jgi:tRNA-splicing ligase RtcB (3'-phosphate/5'-hydroxy nucleic acid ligase)